MDKKHAINFRPFLLVAVGVWSGMNVAFFALTGRFALSCLLIPLLFLFFVLYRHVSVKRNMAVFLVFLLSFGIGAALFCGNLLRYERGMDEGEYEICGEVESLSVGSAYRQITVGRLVFDGERVEGKLILTASEEVKIGDQIRFSGMVEKFSREDFSVTDGAESRFAQDVRYRVRSATVMVEGVSGNPFLKIRRLLYDCLHENMDADSADVTFALLTGDTRDVDDGFAAATRYSGIAHIFAVSGLHIGILFGAVGMLFKRRRKLGFCASLFLSALYSGFCGFSVSSLRAVVMCAVLGAGRLSGRKTDFLESLSFAAIVVMLLFPAQTVGAGFRLSFGACLGLAFLSAKFSHLFRKLPAFLANYLSAMLSVQIFLFPVMLDAFGYFSVWGMVLNFLVIPALPVLFLGMMISSALALLLPFGAGFFLLLPRSMVGALNFFFSVCDFSFVIKGFSLGAGMVVWFLLCFCFSDKFRLSCGKKAVACSLLAVVFSLYVTAYNLTMDGVTVKIDDHGTGVIALVQTKNERVVVLSEGVLLYQAEDFWSRNIAGGVDCVILLSEGDGQGIHTACFLNGEEVRAYFSAETGLQNKQILSDKAFSYGELNFHFLASDALSLDCFGVRVVFSFSDWEEFGGDFLVAGGCGDLIFYIKSGIIRSV